MTTEFTVHDETTAPTAAQETLAIAKKNFGMVPNLIGVLAEAPAAGQTIFEFDDSSTGADAYRLLAEEFLMRAAEHQVVTDDGMKLAPKKSEGVAEENAAGGLDRNFVR